VQHSVKVRSLRDERQTIDEIIKVAHDLSLRGWVLYPTREETVAAISANREELAQYLRVPTPAWSSVRPAWDKRETYRLSEKLSIATPRTWFPASEAELGDVDLSTPVVIKPAIKEHFVYATGDKAWRADTRDALRDGFRRADRIVGQGEVIVQQLIPGGGERQFAYCALFKGGKVLADMTVCRQRQHPSDFGRASTFVETVDLRELADPSARFLEAIDYYGLVELEYKQDAADGAYKLLDVNARTWGYHTLGLESGVDFPYMLHRDQLGMNVQPAHARTGVRWIRLVTDVPNAALDIKAGRSRVRDYLRSLRGIDTEAVFSLRDPLPGLYELALLPYLALKRGL
jgi:predicted ATP-grasp superfamily ATP-dependent carboligase